MKANFRAIAATNRSIPEALAENRLRSDLYYRLNTFQIEVPRCGNEERTSRR
jgi:Transcriptional regulator containing PAS, AAA-type ATPase, and DNA-binding domains